jgi:RNase II-type exonuclease C-terminal S1 domain
VQLLEPAVIATLEGEHAIPLGSTLEVRLAAADPQAGCVRFTLA